MRHSITIHKHYANGLTAEHFAESVFCKWKHAYSYGFKNYKELKCYIIKLIKFT